MKIKVETKPTEPIDATAKVQALEKVIESIKMELDGVRDQNALLQTQLMQTEQSIYTAICEKEKKTNTGRDKGRSADRAKNNASMQHQLQEVNQTKALK